LKNQPENSNTVVFIFCVDINNAPLYLGRPIHVVIIYCINSIRLSYVIEDFSFE